MSDKPRERYPILKKRLEADDCKLGTEEFIEIVCDLFVANHRCTDEELLCQPIEAEKYCEQVRKKVRAKVSDLTILRTLTNCRKRETDVLHGK